MQHTINDVTAEIMFLAVLSSDSKTGATGKTLTVTRCKSGQHGFSSAAGTVTECGSGWYAYLPVAGDVDTIGDLAFHATATGTDIDDWKGTIVPAIPTAAAIAALVAAPNAATIAAAVAAPNAATIATAVGAQFVEGTTTWQGMFKHLKALLLNKTTGPSAGTGGGFTAYAVDGTTPRVVTTQDPNGYRSTNATLNES